MFDARLNSVHLEATRREEFRAARDEVLSSRGEQTLAGEQRAALEAPSGVQNTAIQNVPENLAVAGSLAGYVLMDHEFIYPLKVGLNTVGRMPDNDVVVQDAYVSRRHCAVVIHTNDRCELHDVASKNGTYLNGHKIAGPTRLYSGDQIRMCNRNMVFLRKADVPKKQISVQATRTE